MVIRFYTTRLQHPQGVAFFVIPFEVPTPAGPAIILGKGQIHQESDNWFSVVWSKHKQGWMSFCPDNAESARRLDALILDKWDEFRNNGPSWDR